MSKAQFRKHILHSILFQVSFIATILCALYITGKSGMGNEGQLIVSIVGVVAFFLGCKFFYRPQSIMKRFEEIFPEKKLSRNFVTFTIFFPFYFLIMILILCFKDQSENNKASKFFTYRFALPSVALLLILQFYFTPIAYLTAIPSFYFIMKTTDDSLNILEAKESLGLNSTVLEDYKKRFNSTLSSTEIILLSAQTAKNIADEKRSTASEENEKKVLNFNKAMTLVNQMTELLKESESYKLRLSDYGPLQWIHHSAPAEILLISSVELLILKRFNETVHGKMNTIIAGLEKHIDSIPVKEQEGLKQQLAEAKAKLKKISGS